MRDGLYVFKAVNAHQVVSRKLNPARADVLLTPSPEELPTPLIHPVRDAKGNALQRIEHGDFFRRRVNLLVQFSLSKNISPLRDAQLSRR